MKLPSRLALVTSMLVVLLPALAVLQYKWVGELGDAARDRMQRNLHNAAQQFRDSFDTEIARAFLSLQVDSAGAGSERYAERYGAWASTTAYPWLVANVFVVDAAGGELRLQRWDPQARVFSAAAWEGPLAALRPDLTSELAAFSAGELRRHENRRFGAHEDLLIAPLVHVQFGADALPDRLASIRRVFGFTVIQLNMDGIRTRLLPALADRHFSQTDGEGYRVAVVDASNPRQVVYQSSEALTEASHADVSVPLFAVHPDPMLFLARGAAGDVRPGAGEKRNLFLSVLREQREDRVTIRSRVSNGADGRWRLLAQHGRGSLDAAVGGVRQRNLVISFGILLLMGVSVGLLVLSSRRAQQLAQQRMEFVAGVSHELRTPVAVIHSAAENLSQGFIGDSDRVRRYGQAIEVEARRLREMVERVLHFAGIESGRVVRRPVAIEPIIEEAIAAAVPQALEPITIEKQISPDLPLVLGDAGALRSAIQNLIGNAVKYGGADRWIRIRARTDGQGRESHIAVRERTHMVVRERRTGPEVRISVEDHGPGIAPADLPHIFDPFYRGGNAAKRQIQGSGLGLALVRAIAQAHGGGVSVVTREGEGTTFTLHVPVAPAPAERVPLPSPNEAAAR